MPASGRVERTPRRLARARTVEALAGRRWLLALLAARAADEVPAPPRLARASWRLVLSVESAGLPTSRALRLHGLGAPLPAELASAVEEVATEELQRVLMARAQLLQLDAVAVALGAAPVVIKGGAVAMSAEPLDLGDVDVMLPSREEALRFVGGLDAANYRRRFPTADEEATRHFVRDWPGGLGVEVHVRADYGPAIVGGDPVGIAGLRAVRRSAAGEEAVRILRHTVVEHAYRRGHLRDVVLLSQALGRCGAAELAGIRGGLGREACATEQGGMLALAELVGSGGEVVDPFAAVSALRYELRQRPPRGSEAIPVYFGALQRSAGEVGPWARWAAGLLTGPIEPRSRWYLAGVRRVSSPGGAVLGYAGRTVYRGAVLARAAAWAVGARWRARRLAATSRR